MMREFSKKKLGLAVVAGIGAVAAANTADAALITFHLVPTSVSDGGTIVGGNVNLLPGSSSVVNFNIVASVANNNTTHTDDGMSQQSSQMLSTEAASTGLFGNLQVTANNTWNLSSPGTQTDLDGHPQDLEVGGTDQSVATGFFNTAHLDQTVSPPASTIFGTGAGVPGDTADFIIGTGTWTAGSNVTLGNTTAISMAQRVSPSNLGQGQTVKYTTDGVAKSEKGNNTDVSNGTGFSINVVPEPTSLGLLGLGAMGLIARGRRRA